MMKNKKKSKLILVIGSLMALAIGIFMPISSRFLPQNLNGVFQAVQFFICLVMVINDSKRGRIISNILLVFSSVGVMRAVLGMGDLTALPGVVYMVMYIFTLNYLSVQLTAREKEVVTDFLTGLGNRRGLHTELSKMIEKNQCFYLIYFDIDNFKIINDNFGHRYGDMILKEFAGRMKEYLGDQLPVFRVGGDEFAIILSSKEDPEAAARNLIYTLEQEYQMNISGGRIDNRLSIFAGVTECPKDGKSVEELVKYAEIAMYKAAKDKGDSLCFFNKDMADHLKRQFELEKQIKECLEKDKFFLNFQPQFDSKNKELRGFEALIRMQGADGNLIGPSFFIPEAEQNELILHIDQYVLNKAMREFKPILEKTNKNIVLSINVSAKNAASSSFAERLLNIMDYNDFPAKNLEIEITEYCLLQSMETTIANINKLKEAGIKIALDDFGTGYTSLSYLAKLPINLLKLDKCLVDDITQDEKSADFIKTVVTLGHIMDCEVIAEGVEEIDQLKLLQEIGCDYIQGFIWGKPERISVAESLVIRSNDN